MEFALALIGAVLGAASIVLHVVAPKTKNTTDDKIVALIDAALSKITGK
jgi:formate hydrogenlyase subunit 3/multisubunit Na+/H+ antiporter MnhD subunit